MGLQSAGEGGPGWTVKRVDAVPVEKSDCGERRRLFSRDDPSPAAFIHRVRIRDGAPHYHRIATEYYYVLEGEGTIVLDGAEVPIGAGACIEVRPGVVHAARGDLLVLVIGIPDISEGDLYLP